MPGLLRYALIVIACVVMLAGCAKEPPRPSKEELAKGQHLEKPFTPPGRCFGKPSKCVSDAQCAPPFSLCQEGVCCSGQLNPDTCECRCGDGPACSPREVCCDAPPRESVDPAQASGRQAEAKRVLRCQPIRDCYGGE